MRRRILPALLLAPLLALGCSTRQPLQRFQFAQIIMGTRVDIAAYAESPEKATNAARAAFAAMNALDAILSDYRPDSEAMLLCSRPAGTPVTVSDDLYEVLRRSLEISEATGGAFDVTVGPLIGLWRQARRTGALPDPDALRTARAKVGWQNVTLGRDSVGHPTATLLVEGMRLDFGGIGKGYAADRALAVLRAEGVPRALVAVAGDIAAGDPPPDEEGWRIGLSLGGAAGGDCKQRHQIAFNQGISTSGSTEQFVEIGGARYSHIVDPRTGIGVTDGRVVTVKADDATTADALATAFCIMDIDRSIDLSEKLGVLTLFHGTDSHGNRVRWPAPLLKAISDLDSAGKN